MNTSLQTDNAPDVADEITVAVHINKQYESIQDLDSTQDQWKPAQLEKTPIKLSNLREDIPTAFRHSKSFKSLLYDKNYEWKIFSYYPSKADMEIIDDNDLQDQVSNFMPSYDDGDDDDDVTNSDKYLKLRVVFFKRDLEDEKSNDQSQQRKGGSPVIIKKGQIMPYYIEPTDVTDDCLSIKLSLNEPVAQKMTFYIHEYGKEARDNLGVLRVRKGKKEAVQHVDIDEIESKSFKIAVYQNENDQQPVSNVLDITISDEEIEENYEPNPILLSTLKAVQIDDEKEGNVYIYFDIPPKIRGEEIGFKINYLGGGDSGGDESELVSIPIVIAKSLIPQSFTIITSTTINDKEYLSKPSEVITVDFEKPLSMIIDYIYSDDAAVNIHFDKNIDFNTFKQIIIDELKINDINHDELKIGYIGKDKNVDVITTKTFDSILCCSDITRAETRICVGFDPDPPIISEINIETEGEYTFTLKAKRMNTFKFEMKSEKEEDAIKLAPDTTRNLNMKIRGINPYGRYKVRLRAINQFGESDWSEWTEWLQQREKLDEIKYDDVNTDISPWDGYAKLSHFMQIMEITSEDFNVRLDVLQTDTKRRKYVVKDIENIDGDELVKINIKKKKTSGERAVDFDEDHANEYEIAIYGKDNNKQISDNIIKLIKYPEDLDNNYKPPAIDPSTVIKILDKNDKKAHLYWNTPSGAFGKMEYRIIYNKGNERKEDQTDLLPYSMPLSLIPIEIKVITVSIFEDDQKTCFSEPVPIQIGHKPLPTQKPKSEIITITTMEDEEKYESIPSSLINANQELIFGEEIKYEIELENKSECDEIDTVVMDNNFVVDDEYESKASEKMYIDVADSTQPLGIEYLNKHESISLSEWQCVGCTVYNSINLWQCHLCGFMRNEEEKKIEPQQIEVQSTQNMQWKCERCTVLNHIDLPYCEECGGSKYYAINDVKQWECNICKMRNYIEMPYCEQCLCFRNYLLNEEQKEDEKEEKKDDIKDIEVMQYNLRNECDRLNAATKLHGKQQDLSTFTSLMAILFEQTVINYKKLSLENLFKTDIIKDLRILIDKLFGCASEVNSYIKENDIQQTIGLIQKYWKLFRESKDIITSKQHQIIDLVELCNEWQKILDKRKDLPDGQSLDDKDVTFMRHVGIAFSYWFQCESGMNKMQENWRNLLQELQEKEIFWIKKATEIKEVMDKQRETLNEKQKKERSNWSKWFRSIASFIGIAVIAVSAVVAFVFSGGSAAAMLRLGIAADIAHQEELIQNQLLQEQIKQQKQMHQLYDNIKNIQKVFTKMREDTGYMNTLFAGFIDLLLQPKGKINVIQEKMKTDDINFNIIGIHVKRMTSSFEELGKFCNKVVKEIDNRMEVKPDDYVTKK